MKLLDAHLKAEYNKKIYTAVIWNVDWNVNGNVMWRGIKFLSFWSRKRWKRKTVIEKESDCTEDWASEFGDRSLTIGKSGLESLIQSKT